MHTYVNRLAIANLFTYEGFYLYYLHKIYGGGFSKCGRERNLDPYRVCTPFAFRRRNMLKVFKSSHASRAVGLLRPQSSWTHFVSLLYQARTYFQNKVR